MSDIIDQIISAACIPEEDAIFARRPDERCLIGPAEERERLAKLMFEKMVVRIDDDVNSGIARS